MNRVNQATGAACCVSLSFKFDRSPERKIMMLEISQLKRTFGPNTVGDTCLEKIAYWEVLRQALVGR